MATTAIPTVQRLTANNVNTDASSYAMASVSPNATGRLVLACVALYNATGTPSVPTCAGTNAYSGTWTQVDTVAIGSNTRIAVFWSVTQSTTAGVVTFTCGETEQAATWSLIEVTNANTTAPIVQTKQYSSTATIASSTITLDNALTAPFNITIGWFAHQANVGPTGSSTTGLTFDVGASGSTSDGLSRQVSFTFGLAVTWTYTSTAVSKVGIAAEIAQSGSGIYAPSLVGTGGLA